MLSSRRHPPAAPARITRKMNSRGRQICGISLSLILINLAAIMERADENLLPAVYKEVSEAFNAGPSDLGYLTFIRNFVQGLASPLAGVLVLVHDRPTVLALGTFCWAVSTAAVGVSQRFLQVAFWRAVNGFGLAIVVPSLASFIADSYAEEARGTGFGVVNVIGSFGGIGGGVAATIMAGQSFYGFPGWRFAFILMASLSLVIGCLVFLCVSDPGSAIKASPRDELKILGSRTRSGAKQVWEESVTAMRTVVRIKTFQFIVLQGLVGSLPWTAMVFFTMWFELIGFDHKSAAALLSFFAVGCAGGSLIGGLIADRMAKTYPSSGRVLCAQFSACMGIPYAYVLLRAIPQTVASYSAYAWTLFTMGVFISWNGTAANAPMFAEVVPARHRTMIYAFDRAFELSFSSFAAPLVGILSENVFGYDGKRIGPVTGSARDALALSKGLLAMMSLPFALCCLLYTPLHFYFKKDREASRSSDDVAMI